MIMTTAQQIRQWKAISKSEAGILHLKNQQPCQDYGDYVINGDFLIGAVADGAGSAKCSHIGAKETVTFMINHFSKFINKSRIRLLKKYKNIDREKSLLTLSTAKIKSIFIRAIKKLQTKLQTIAENLNCSFKDLACTLILFIANQEGIYAMQIGDGFLTISFPEENYQLVFTPYKGEYHNETFFITSDIAIESMQCKFIKGNYPFICASTDGLEFVALKLPELIPFSPFFRPLEQYMFQTEEPEKEDEYIINFLKSERLNLRTNDDKTLLLALQCVCSI